MLKFLYRTKPIDYNFSFITRLSEQVALKLICKGCQNRNKNHLTFAKAIKIVPEDYTGTLPSHLMFIPCLKIMYELRRKHGLTYSAWLPKPSVTPFDILRPLTPEEVPEFHQFCRDNPLAFK